MTPQSSILNPQSAQNPSVKSVESVAKIPEPDGQIHDPALRFFAAQLQPSIPPIPPLPPIIDV